MPDLITDIDFKDGWLHCDYIPLHTTKLLIRLAAPGIKHVILPNCDEYQAFEVEILRQYFDEIYFYDSNRAPLCFVKQEKKLTFIRFNRSLHVLSVDDQVLWQ